jgi:hypothetical protein
MGCRNSREGQTSGSAPRRSPTNRRGHPQPGHPNREREWLGFATSRGRVTQTRHPQRQPIHRRQHPSRSGTRPRAQARRGNLERVHQTSRGHALGQRFRFGANAYRHRCCRVVPAVLDPCRQPEGHRFVSHRQPRFRLGHPTSTQCFHADAGLEPAVRLPHHRPRLQVHHFLRRGL